jgi:hypothetical protein
LGIAIGAGLSYEMYDLFNQRMEEINILPITDKTSVIAPYVHQIP